MWNSFKLLTATLALGAVALGSSVAQANPISFYYSTNGVNYTQFGSTADGSNSATLAGAGFSISASGLGTPFLPAPNFQSSSINFLSTGPVTLFVAAVETGLSTPSITGFNLGFTNNAQSTVSVTESFGVLLSNSFTPTILASQVLATNTATTAFAPYAGPLPANYGVVQIYSATFGANGGIVNATISETGVVPEPLSISLLGVGLAGLGLLRMRRKSV